MTVSTSNIQFTSASIPIQASRPSSSTTAAAPVAREDNVTLSPTAQRAAAAASAATSSGSANESQTLDQIIAKAAAGDIRALAQLALV